MQEKLAGRPLLMHTRLGDMKAVVSKFTEALRHYDQALEVDPVSERPLLLAAFSLEGSFVRPLLPWCVSCEVDTSLSISICPPFPSPDVSTSTHWPGEGHQADSRYDGGCGGL